MNDGRDMVGLEKQDSERSPASEFTMKNKDAGEVSRAKSNVSLA